MTRDGRGSCRHRAERGAVSMVLTVATLSSCSGLLYGASFDYPVAPPVPPGATVVVRDKGWDEDDPIRSQVQVIDAQRSSVDELLAFYRSVFPEVDGWTPTETKRRQRLCLVNRTDDGYTEVFEVHPYDGSRVAGQPDRRLVVLSRIEQAPDRPCGHALGWINVDLLGPHRPAPVPRRDPYPTPTPTSAARG